MRTRLNSAAITAAGLIAGLVFAATGSWLLALAIAGALLAGGLHNGSIRLRHRR